MSAIVATTDPAARTSVKAAGGQVANLPSYQAHKQHIPATEVVKNYSFNTTGTWSSYSQVILTPDALPDVCDQFTLVLNLSAITKTGGTYASFVNDGSFLTKMIEVRVGANLITTLYPESWYLGPVLHLSTEDKLRYLPAIGNATQANRRTAASSAQTISIDIPVPFVNMQGWNVKAHSGQQLDIKVYHADLTTVVQTDGTAPACTINSVQLLVSGRNYLNQHNLINTVLAGRKMGHVDQRFLDPIQQSFVLPSGSAQYTVQLTNMAGLYSHLLFVVRASSNLGTPLGNSPDTFAALASYTMLDSAGNIILPQTSSAYALGNYAAKYVRGDLTDFNSGLATTEKDIYAVFFDRHPYESLRSGTQDGFMKLDGLAKLQLNFATATSANYQVDVIGYLWSNVVTSAAGVVTKQVVVG